MKKQPSEVSAPSRACPDQGSLPADCTGIRSRQPLDVKSVSGYWRGGWPLNADVRIVEFTDGTRVETRDPVIKALSVDVQHHRCQIEYALQHIEGWCECEDKDGCIERARQILRAADHYVTPEWYRRAIETDSRTNAGQTAESAADATAPQSASLLKADSSVSDAAPTEGEGR